MTHVAVLFCIVIYYISSHYLWDWTRLLGFNFLLGYE